MKRSPVRSTHRLTFGPESKVLSTAVPTVLVIGNLDGVHLGHQALLRQARSLATQHGLPVTALTFDPHPSLVLRGSAPPRLTTIERRVELLRRHGADDVVVEHFTPALATLTPREWDAQLLGTRGARAVVVGKNFFYGAKRAGNLETMREHGKELGFEVAVADFVGDEGGPFSSTRVRDAIARGDLDESARLLGRRHSLSGIIEHGDHRGRTIGFPTANVSGASEILPPFGVYAVFADDRPAVMNLGVRPTVDGHSLRIEVHLFDFEGDLYGTSMSVHFVKRIRDEQRFDGLDALKAQIAVDAAAARVVLAALRPGDGE